MELVYFALNYRCVVPKTWLSFSQFTNGKEHTYVQQWN